MYELSQKNNRKVPQNTAWEICNGISEGISVKLPAIEAISTKTMLKKILLDLQKKFQDKCPQDFTMKFLKDEEYSIGITKGIAEWFSKDNSREVSKEIAEGIFKSIFRFLTIWWRNSERIFSNKFPKILAWEMFKIIADKIPKGNLLQVQKILSNKFHKPPPQKIWKAFLYTSQRNCHNCRRNSQKSFLNSFQRSFQSDYRGFLKEVAVEIPTGIDE